MINGDVWFVIVAEMGLPFCLFKFRSPANSQCIVVIMPFTTVVLKLNWNTHRERDVIFPCCLFLFLFWASKKEKEQGWQRRRVIEFWIVFAAGGLLGSITIGSICHFLCLETKKVTKENSRKERWRPVPFIVLQLSFCATVVSTLVFHAYLLI